MDAGALAAAQKAVKTFVAAAQPQDADRGGRASGRLGRRRGTGRAGSGRAAHRAASRRSRAPMALGAYKVGNR